MKLKDLINILAEMWPYMRENEKEELCTSLTNGNIFHIISTFKKIKENVLNRAKAVEEEPNEN